MSRTGRSMRLCWEPPCIKMQTNQRAARTIYGPIFLPFYVNFVSFFSFFCQDANKIGSNLAIISCNLLKKDKLAMYKTQGGEPNYVDHKFFFKTKTSKYYPAG